MKIIISLALLLTTISTFADGFIPGLPDGSYKGRLRAQEKGGIHLITQSYPGCDGCFIAIGIDGPDLFDPDVRLVAYSAIPRVSGERGKKTITNKQGTFVSFDSYALTPIGVDADGNLTLPNENPSDILSIYEGAGTENARFTIVNANSGNELGIPSSMIFARTLESPFEFTDPISGTYRMKGKSRINSSISSVIFNSEDHSRSAQVTWLGDVRNKGGNYMIREKIPGIFSFAPISYFASGQEEQNMPRRLLMFVNLHGNPHLLGVNPVNQRDVSCWKVKKPGRDQAEAIAIAPNTQPAILPQLPIAPNLNSLEYPGGPSSGMSIEDIQGLGNWSINVNNALISLENRVEKLSDEIQIRNTLYDTMKTIAGETEMKPGDLLLRQSLYSGIYLADIIRRESLDKAPTPGAVYRQIHVLKRAVTLARKYYNADVAYTKRLYANPQDRRVYFNDQLIEFGVELSQYIMEMSTGMIPIDASSAYGMLRWSLGVLNRKVLEDDRNTVFADTINYLYNTLNTYPQVESLESDVQAIEFMTQLKALAQDAFERIDSTKQMLLPKK